MFLTLLLLNLQSKAASKNTLKIKYWGFVRDAVVSCCRKKNWTLSHKTVVKRMEEMAGFLGKRKA